MREAVADGNHADDQPRMAHVMRDHRPRRLRHVDALRAKTRKGGSLCLCSRQQLLDRALDRPAFLERREARMDDGEQAGPVGKVSPERGEAGFVGRCAEAIQMVEEGPCIRCHVGLRKQRRQGRPRRWRRRDRMVRGQSS